MSDDHSVRELIAAWPVHGVIDKLNLVFRFRRSCYYRCVAVDVDMGHQHNATLADHNVVARPTTLRFITAMCHGVSTESYLP